MNRTDADLVVHAKHVHTMVENDPGTYTSVAVVDGVIVRVGTRSEAETWSTRHEMDFGSGTLVPGLTDSHLHPILGGVMTSGMDLSEAREPEQVRELLVEAERRLGPGEWLQAWGLDPNVYGGFDRIRAEDVDPTAGKRAMFIRLFDAHAAIVNQEALRLAGVTGPVAFKQASRIGVDVDGKPDGLLYEWPAMDYVHDHIPPASVDTQARDLLAVLAKMAASGLTGGHVMDAQGAAFAVLERAEEIGDLPLRLRVHPWCSPGRSIADLEALAALQERRGKRWSVGGVKLFADGTIDNGTAWLAEPDRLGESTSSFWLDTNELSETIAWLDAHRINTATHAIGDAAVAFTLEAIARTGQRAKHRIEHIETVPDETIRRFAEVGVAASMQPAHCTHFSSADHTDNWSQRLGEGRAQRAWRTRSFRDVGVTVATGSDWPVADFDPRPIMADAQLRRQVNRPEQEPHGRAEALTARMALEGYTSHAAKAAGQENAGRIDPGCLADFTIFAADPLALSPEHLATVPVLATFIGGEIVAHPR